MSSFLSPRRFRGGPVLLTAAALLAGVLIGFRALPRTAHSRHPAPAFRPADLASGDGVAAPHPMVNESAPETSRTAAGPGVTVAAPTQPAPAAVTQAFPSITEVTPDWRDFRPESVTVAPYPDLPVKFTRTALRDEGRYVTWIGRNPDLPGASLVGVATAKGYDAILVMPGASQFSYHVRGDKVVMTESAPGEESCGNAPVRVKPAVPPLAAAAKQTLSYADGYAPLPDNFVETVPIKVDVLIAYDAETLALATAKSSDPVGYIDGQYKALVETSNLALGQSLVTAFAWRYLGAVPAPAYTRTGKLGDDLNAMEPGGAIVAWVRSTRFQRGADQITLVVGHSDDWGGIASSPKQRAVTADFACSAVEWGQSYKVVSHEWAHNFGCQHDRGHYSVPSPDGTPTSAPDNDGFWCYGHLWENPPVPPGFASGSTGDIMSYGDWIIPYFSNPNITLHITGALVGRFSSLELGTFQIGRPESDPKAAYAARVLNDQALAMSNLAEEISMPAITQQPANTSAERGTYLNLSVKVTGGGLVYQWLKGGVAISGATTPTYSKLSEDADAGSYTVTATNLMGTVTSNAAIVTITAPLPPPPSSSSGGGGGGGGAPSLWFLGLLGLGGWRRCFRARTHGGAEQARKMGRPTCAGRPKGGQAAWRRFRT